MTITRIHLLDLFVDVPATPMYAQHNPKYFKTVPQNVAQMVPKCLKFASQGQGLQRRGRPGMRFQGRGDSWLQGPRLNMQAPQGSQI